MAIIPRRLTPGVSPGRAAESRVRQDRGEESVAEGLMATRSMSVELIGEIKERIADQFMRQAARLGCAYADLRLEVVESQFAWAENGHSKQSGKDET
jgi:hypothetical protein